MDEKELDKMAKDIEPIAEPVDPGTTGAPSGFVEDRETYVKPDGETTSTPERTPTVIKEDSHVGKWVMGGVLTLFILGLGASTAWLYTDAQSARNELQSTKTGLDAARADAAKLRTEVAVAQKKETETPVAELATTEQLADDAAKAYKTAASGVSYFVRKEKVKGDFASLYMKAEVPNAESEMVLLKKANGQLVEVKRISGVPVITKEVADFLKDVYGIDVKELGVTIE